MDKEELRNGILYAITNINRNAFFQSLQRKLKGENLLLAMLFDVGGKSTPGALAEVLNITAARVTAIIHSLEHKDLVERLANNADKRKATVQLTEKGTAFVEKVRAEAILHSERIMEKIGEQDTHEFLRIMNKIIEAEKGDFATVQPPETARQKDEVNHDE